MSTSIYDDINIIKLKQYFVKTKHYQNNKLPQKPPDLTSFKWPPPSISRVFKRKIML